MNTPLSRSLAFSLAFSLSLFAQGFDSYGMVMCASSADGSQTEFVTPPEGAKLGEQVSFEGMSGEPASSAAVKKKKICDAVFPDLKTNADCVACYKGVPMNTSAGPCVVKSVADAFIK